MQKDMVGDKMSAGEENCDEAMQALYSPTTQDHHIQRMRPVLEAAQSSTHCHSRCMRGWPPPLLIGAIPGPAQAETA
jgi:hypothetical protein